MHSPNYSYPPPGFSGDNASPPPSGYSPSYGQSSERPYYPASSTVRVGHQPNQYYPPIVPAPHSSSYRSSAEYSSTQPRNFFPTTSEAYANTNRPPRPPSAMHGPSSRAGYLSTPHAGPLAMPSGSRPRSSMSAAPMTSSGERFICSVCGKDFSRAHDRKRHHETQHATTPVTHKCVYCEKDFSRADSLKRHIQNGCDEAQDSAVSNSLYTLEVPRAELAPIPYANSQPALPSNTVSLIHQLDDPEGIKRDTFVIYAPSDQTPQLIEHKSFTSNDLSYIQNTPDVGCLVSIHEPGEATVWMEENWGNPLIASIQNCGCGGPFPCMLSPKEPALTIFGSYKDPMVLDMAQSLADLACFPVVIRPPQDNPELTLTRDADMPDVPVDFGAVGASDQRGGDDDGDEPMPQDDRIPGPRSGDSGNGGRRGDDSDGSTQLNEHDLNMAEEVQEHTGPPLGTKGGGAGDGGDGGGGPSEVEGQWNGPLHRTRVELGLKLGNAQTYAISIGYTFKFTINRETEIPIDLNNLTQPLSQPEVMALVDLKIETRPRETEIDRSYASIGFVAHRTKSIIDREFLHRGFDLPDKTFQRQAQQQIQRGITAALGFSQGSPLAQTTFSYNHNHNATMQATDSKVMPKCRVDYETGDKWDKNNKSYSSYNFAYQAQAIQVNGERPQWHPLEVKVGMGINLRPAGSEKPLPKISFVNRHQVLIWVSDPASRSRIRGIVVLLNSYLDNIRTEEKLSIYEREEIALAAGSSTRVKAEEHQPGTISLSIAEVQKEEARSSTKLRAVVRTSLTRLGRPSTAQRPLPDIPPYEYLARGWDATNNEWRSVLWPALDKHFRAADLEETPPVRKIECPWRKARTMLGANITP